MAGLPGYEMTCFFKFRNTFTKSPVATKGRIVRLTKQGSGRQHVSIARIALQSVFPNVPTGEYLLNMAKKNDGLDFQNLSWLTLSEQNVETKHTEMGVYKTGWRLITLPEIENLWPYIMNERGDVYSVTKSWLLYEKNKNSGYELSDDKRSYSYSKRFLLHTFVFENPEQTYMRHPMYGLFHTGWYTCANYPNYEMNWKMQVRKKSDGWIIQPNCRGVTLSQERIDLGELALLSLFTHVPRGEFLFNDATQGEGHEDGNYKNNTIDNLKFLTRSENSRQSHTQVTRDYGSAQEKPLYLLDGYCGNPIKEYQASKYAAEDLGIGQNSIRFAAASMGKQKIKNMYFAYKPQTLLPGEYFQTSPTLDAFLGQSRIDNVEKVLISNCGRVRMSNGRLTRGSKVKRIGMGKYRQVSVRKKQCLVHQLVWMAFQDSPSPKQGEKDENGNTIVLCHDDSVSLDEEGCYKNYPDHLRLDTQNNNLLEHHASKKRKRSHDDKK